MSGYTQLTWEQRYQIHVLLHTGQNPIKIAIVVGVHKATISRELRCNRGLRGYRPHQAHHLAQARQTSKRRPRLAPTTWQQVETLVRQAWSPEQICCRLKSEHDQTTSHEYIYQDKPAGGDLYRSLRCQKAGRKRDGPYSRRGRIATPVIRCFKAVTRRLRPPFVRPFPVGFGLTRLACRRLHMTMVGI